MIEARRGEPYQALTGHRAENLFGLAWYGQAWVGLSYLLYPLTVRSATLQQRIFTAGSAYGALTVVAAPPPRSS